MNAKVKVVVGQLSKPCPICRCEVRTPKDPRIGDAAALAIAVARHIVEAHKK